MSRDEGWGKMQCHFCAGEMRKGEAAYMLDRLLNWLERLGIELRPEIDDYFSKIGLL